MKNNFANSLDAVFASEGGFANLKGDSGGRTMYGITEVTWLDWNARKGIENPKDITEITQEEAEEIYYTDYWEKQGCNEIAVGLDYCLFDYSIHAGQPVAAKAIQRLVGAEADGIIGTRTIAAINRCKVKPLIEELSTQREEFTRTLRIYTLYPDGMENRLKHARDAALRMLEGVTNRKVSVPVVPKAKGGEKASVKVKKSVNTENIAKITAGAIPGVIGAIAAIDVPIVQIILALGIVVALGFIGVIAVKKLT